jgi:hypothetical protein
MPTLKEMLRMSQGMGKVNIPTHIDAIADANSVIEIADMHGIQTEDARAYKDLAIDPTQPPPMLPDYSIDWNQIPFDPSEPPDLTDTQANNPVGELISAYGKTLQFQGKSVGTLLKPVQFVFNRGNKFLTGLTGGEAGAQLRGGIMDKYVRMQMYLSALES